MARTLLWHRTTCKVACLIEHLMRPLLQADASCSPCSGGPKLRTRHPSCSAWAVSRRTFWPDAVASSRMMMSPCSVRTAKRAPYSACAQHPCNIMHVRGWAMLMRMLMRTCSAMYDTRLKGLAYSMWRCEGRQTGTERQHPQVIIPMHGINGRGPRKAREGTYLYQSACVHLYLRQKIPLLLCLPWGENSDPAIMGQGGHAAMVMSVGDEAR